MYCKINGHAINSNWILKSAISSKLITSLGIFEGSDYVFEDKLI